MNSVTVITSPLGSPEMPLYQSAKGIPSHLQLPALPQSKWQTVAEFRSRTRLSVLLASRWLHSSGTVLHSAFKTSRLRFHGSSSRQFHLLLACADCICFVYAARSTIGSNPR